MNNALERQVKRELYEQLAQIGKAFGSARRMQLIELLAQSEYTVEQLAVESGMTVANTSQHLKVLRSTRLVEVRRQGVEAYYRLATDSVFTAWDQMRLLAEERLADIEKLIPRLHNEDLAGFMPFDEFRPLLENEIVVALDVRPVVEYISGHIRGALCIPLLDLPHRYHEIDQKRQIIVYCRGPYSTYSTQAMQLLQSWGYRARRLAAGFPQWRAAGLPVATGHFEMEELVAKHD